MCGQMRETARDVVLRFRIGELVGGALERGQAFGAIAFEQRAQRDQEGTRAIVARVALAPSQRGDRVGVLPSEASASPGM